MAYWAFIDANSKLVNYIESEGEPGYVPEGCTAVEIPTDSPFGFDWTWDGEKFVDTSATPLQPVPESITRRQCAMMMFSMQMISGPEAIAMTQSGIPPAAVQAYLDQLPEPNRTLAVMDFAAANYFRENPLLLALMVANGMTSEQVDDFFRGASQL